MKTKVCTKCGEEKPVSEFYRNQTRADGYQTWCKSCHYKKRKTRRPVKPEKTTKARKAEKIDISQLFSRIIGLVDEFRYVNRDNMMTVKCPTLKSFLKVCKILQKNGDMKVHANSNTGTYEIEVELIF